MQEHPNYRDIILKVALLKKMYACSVPLGGKLSEFNYLNSQQYNAISSISKGILLVWSMFAYCKSITNFDIHQSNSLVFPF